MLADRNIRPDLQTASSFLPELPELFQGKSQFAVRVFTVNDRRFYIFTVVIKSK